MLLLTYSVSVKASAYGIGGRPAAIPRFPLPLKKSAYGQTRKMRPENGQISYKMVIFNPMCLVSVKNRHIDQNQEKIGTKLAYADKYRLIRNTAANGSYHTSGVKCFGAVMTFEDGSVFVIA